MDNPWSAVGNPRSLWLDPPGDDPAARLLLGMIQVGLALVVIPLMSLTLLLVLFYVIAESSVLHVQSAVHLVGRRVGPLARGGPSFSGHRPIR